MSFQDGVCPTAVAAITNLNVPDPLATVPSAARLERHGRSPNYGNEFTDNFQLGCFDFSHENRLIGWVQRTKLDLLV
jgi:hypothetical protein